MSDRSVARRYAQAFIEVAEEAGVVDQLGDELNVFTQAALANDGALFGVLANPMFTVEERKKVLEAVLASAKPHALTSNLLRLLLDKNRAGVLVELNEIYRRLADDKAGRVQVQVQTAEPLTPQLEAEIRAALEKTTGKTVSLVTEVEPALIGGLVARVGGTVYDSSIRTRLQSIKQALITAQSPAQA